MRDKLVCFVDKCGPLFETWCCLETTLYSYSICGTKYSEAYACEMVIRILLWMNRTLLFDMFVRR